MMSISTLQAMAGRFLSGSDDLLAWEPKSQHRVTDLVRSFQQKQLDPDGLAAGLSSERMGAVPAPASAGVAVLGLTGILMPTPSIFSMLGFGTAVRDFMQQLTAAALDPKVKSILVVVDSPGGSIRLIPEAAAAMRQARGRKPVVVSVPGMAASAAYWIASNAHAIEATPSASVGNIGILVERLSVSRKLEHDGVDVHVLTAGKFKHEGHPALPLEEPERKELQRRVDAAYRVFVDDIAKGRQVSAKVITETYGGGRLVDAPEALQSGMIDTIATVEDTLGRALRAPAEFTGRLTQRTADWQARTDRLTAAAHRGELDTHRARLRGFVERAALR